MAIFLGIGFFFIYWFLLKLDSDQKAAIWQSFREADYWWVIICVLCSLLSHLLRALRWQLLFKPIGYHPGLSNTFGSVIIAYMGNLAFPRAGEVMRCATLRTSENIPVEKSLGTVVTERIIDLIAFGLIVVIGMLVMFGQAKDWLYNTLSEKFDSLPNIAMIIGILVALAMMAFVFYKCFWKKLLHIGIFAKINDLVTGMVDGVKSVFHMGKRNTLLFLLVGMTFSQGGIGVYPALVMMGLTDIYGISMEVGTACGWLLWGSQQAAVIAVGAGYLLYFSIKKRKKNK